jgi:small subunit ribosomal protein S20
MANHASAEKRNRQNARRATVNRARETRIKSFLKKVEAAILAGDKTAAQKALKEAQPKLMQGVSKGVINKSAASRKMSRLSARIKKLAT